MKEIISTIIDAEARGENIIREANVRAKELAISTEAEKQKLIKGSQLLIKQKMSETIRNQDKVATDIYNKMIADGKNAAEKYKKSKSTQKETIKQLIIGRLLEKYGAR